MHQPRFYALLRVFIPNDTTKKCAPLIGTHLFVVYLRLGFYQLYILYSELRSYYSTIVVLNNLIAHINRMSATNPLIMSRLLERNGLNSGVRLLSLNQIHTQVLTLCTHQLRISMIANSKGRKDRRGVAWAKGLEAI